MKILILLILCSFFTIANLQAQNDTRSQKVNSDIVRVNNILVADRNLGSKVPRGGIAQNYTNDKNHSNHKNSLFKGAYYTWEEAKKACSRGWRLPTKEELRAISNVIQFSDDRAYLEDSSGKRCYFPLSGSESDPFAIFGNYWSSSENNYISSNAWYLSVYTNYSYVDSNTYRSSGFSVRCVKTAPQ